MTFRLLLTSVGGAMSPYTIRCLLGSRRHKVEVIGVDASSEALGRHFATVFETVPKGDAPGYAERLLAIADRHRADLILPCSDEETVALARHRAEIESRGHRLACPPDGAIAVMTDKLATLHMLDRCAIPAPEWRLAGCSAALIAALDELAGKHATVVVKPTRSRGSRDVYVIERGRKGVFQPAGHREVYLDRKTFCDDIMATLSGSAPLLVMEGLVAPAHDTDVLCMGGRVLSAVPRQRINPAGVPFRGGIVVADAELQSIASRVAAALDASWLFDIDTMTAADGVRKVIEINCRPSGSLSAAVAAGVPILDDLISLAKGEAIPSTPLPDGATALPYTSIEVVR